MRSSDSQPLGPVLETRRLLDRVLDRPGDPDYIDAVEDVRDHAAKDLWWLSAGVNAAGVARLLHRACALLAAAASEPDHAEFSLMDPDEPAGRLGSVYKARKLIHEALLRVSFATEWSYRLEVAEHRRVRRAYRLRGRLRPARARRPRCCHSGRPRSSRGPPGDDEDPEPDGPSGTGRDR